ncbi:MAG: FprA family A-type flavoprotein [Muribaculaceae bacterium]|nr:FprA family A-type flavoprotein [Muribaculaceae bacterium]
MKVTISDSVRYIGADDLTLDLFEGQYILPEGVSYNSYLILDEKVAVLDTIDARCTQEWEENLAAELQGRTPDYLVVSHLEPDHAANLNAMMLKYPALTAVCTAVAKRMMPQFCPDFAQYQDRVSTVGEGDTLCLGKHTLHFIMASMIHWPEVMMCYEESEKILFSADAFGKFGALCNYDGDWACEARRYYFNIVGKYGAQVQTLLNKAADLEIAKICPLHGPILDDDLDFYLGLYTTWSAYEPETEGVFIAYCSMHGNTAEAAQLLAEEIKAAKPGTKVSIADLARTDMAEDVEDAFRYGRIVFAAPTYDGGIMPVMNDFLHHLAAKTYRNRRVGIIENGSWAPMAGKKIKELLGTLQGITFVEPVVTIKSTLNAASRAAIAALAKEI